MTKLARAPSLSADQMRAVDELAEGRYQIHLLQMMENAGRALARRARDSLGGSVLGRSILVLAGPGGNGGGGLAAARRLHGWGASPLVILSTEPEKLAPVPARQLAAVRAIGATVMIPPTDDLPAADLILDALLGYSAHGAPRPPMDSLVRQANSHPAPIIALDIPTGLDPDSGRPNSPCIAASSTVCLALPKTGLLATSARSYTGALWLADLGIPPELYAELEIEIEPGLFARDDLIELQPAPG